MTLADRLDARLRRELAGLRDACADGLARLRADVEAAGSAEAKAAAAAAWCEAARAEGRAVVRAETAAEWWALAPAEAEAAAWWEAKAAAWWEAQDAKAWAAEGAAEVAAAWAAGGRDPLDDPIVMALPEDVEEDEPPLVWAYDLRPPPCWAGPDWPEALPLPLTTRDALALVEREAPTMAAELAGRIGDAAGEVLPADRARAVLDVADLAERWPWPEPWPRRPGGPAGVNPGWWALDALLDLANLGWWPGEAAPLDVARWARAPLNRLDPGRGDAEVAAAEAGRPLCNPPPVLPSGVALTGGVLALLFLAEREACPWVKEGAPDAFPMDAGRATARVLTAFAGANAAAVEADADVRERRGPEDLVGLTFTWPDKDPTQLDLEDLALPAGAGPLTAVERAYGGAAVRDVLALYLFTWAARAPAGTGVWWWPDEHLDLVGLNPGDKRNRQRLAGLLDNLGRGRLEARYRSGAPLTGPVVAGLLTDGTARLLHLHPAMYHGVTLADGERGDYWFPTPADLLRLPADRTSGRVHILAPVFNRSWRAAWRTDAPDDVPEAMFGAELLADALGIHEPWAPRAGDTLRRTLKAAEACGLVGRWWVEGGDLARLTGTVHATPGEAAMAVLRDRSISRPARLPATGGELAEWMSGRGLTSAAAGTALDVNAGTLRRLVSGDWRGRPLPARVRDALRRRLWPRDGRA